MKISKYIILLLSTLFINISLAGDGNSRNLDDVSMKINRFNYAIFEDGNLLICDRRSDDVLFEITEDYELVVEGKITELDWGQEELVEDYYRSFNRVFKKRDEIISKGVEVGIKGAQLGMKAVSGVFVLIASGFDEDAEREFEDEMEREAEKIEMRAEDLEKIANELEYQIYVINDIEGEMRREINQLDDFDLYLDEDEMDMSFDFDDDRKYDRRNNYNRDRDREDNRDRD